MKTRRNAIITITIATALALAGCDQQGDSNGSGGWFPVFIPWQQPAPVIINNPPPVYRAPAPAVKPPSQPYKPPPAPRPPAPKTK